MRTRDVPNLLSLAVEINRQPVLICSVLGEVLYMNAGARCLRERVAGISSSWGVFDDLEMTSAKGRKKIFWKDLPADMEDEEFRLQVYFPLIHADFLLILKVIRDESFTGVVLTFEKDPTLADSSLEQMLQAEQEKLLNELPVMIAGLDRTGMFKFANKAVVENLGYSMDEIVNNIRFIDVLIPNQRRQRDLIDRVLKEDGATTRFIQAEVMHAQGQQRFIHGYVVYNANSVAKDISYWLLGFDNTAFHRALSSLVESEERFSFISKVSNDAVWDWDLITDKLWWNDGMNSIFGYSAEEVENTYQWWLEHVHPSYIESLNESLKTHIERGNGFWSGEYLFRKKDGIYAYVFDKGYLVKDDKGRPLRFVGGMVDITDIKNANGL